MRGSGVHVICVGCDSGAQGRWREVRCVNVEEGGREYPSLWYSCFELLLFGGGSLV